MNKVQFLASIPPLQSAINVSGDAGSRIKLDIDESNLEAVVQLLAMRGKLLKVTIEVADSDGTPRS